MHLQTAEFLFFLLVPNLRNTRIMIRSDNTKVNHTYLLAMLHGHQINAIIN